MRQGKGTLGREKSDTSEMGRGGFLPPDEMGVGVLLLPADE